MSPPGSPVYGYPCTARCSARFRSATWQPPWQRATPPRRYRAPRPMRCNWLAAARAPTDLCLSVARSTLPRRRCRRWAPESLCGAAWRRTLCSERGEQLGFQRRLRLVADHALLGLAADEEHQRGDAHDPEHAGSDRIGIHVDLDDLDLSVVLTGQFLDDRRDHLARGAPRRPEIDEYRDRGVEH